MIDKVVGSGCNRFFDTGTFDADVVEVVNDDVGSDDNVVVVVVVVVAVVVVGAEASFLATSAFADAVDITVRVRTGATLAPLALNESNDVSLDHRCSSVT